MFRIRVVIYLTFLLAFCIVHTNSNKLKADTKLETKHDEDFMMARPGLEMTPIDPFPIALKCPRPIIIIIIIYIPCSRRFTDDFYPLDISLPGNFMRGCGNRKQYFIRIKSCIPMPRPLPRPFPPFEQLQRMISPRPRIRIIIIIIIIRRDRAMLARRSALPILSSSCSSFDLEEYTPPSIDFEYTDMLLDRLPMSRTDAMLLGKRDMMSTSQDDSMNQDDLMSSIKQRIEMIKKSDSC